MKKVGRKRALSPEKEQILYARLANFYRARREDNPQAIADDLGISRTTVRNYERRLHKDEPGARESAVPSVGAVAPRELIGRHIRPL